jgi:hypothetical protein
VITICESDDWDNEIQKAISHPINRKVIEYLAEETLSFTQLLNKIDGSCEHGKFGYHLRRLAGFVEFEPVTKKYVLTYRGRLLLDIIRDFRRRVQKANQPLKYAEQFARGDHAFALYNTESFKHDISFSFMKAGLLRGKAAVYTVGEEKLDSEVLLLKKNCLDLDSLPKGALTVIPSYEWYIQKGKAESKTIIENWQRLVKEKKKLGFKGCQVAAENATFFDNGKANELLQYEEAIGRKIDLDACAICLFDSKRCKENGVSRIYKSHSHIISEELVGKTTPF